jgi:hypothetical protein
MELDKKTINFYKSLYWDYHVSEEDIIKIIAKDIIDGGKNSLVSKK